MPRAGGLWAYGFAALDSCKNLSKRGPQVGADERGFRGTEFSVDILS